ncbi:MAG: DUF2800 domain-containing protein [Anaerovoracaceae bacterium]|jgi:hypothetical protein
MVRHALLSASSSHRWIHCPPSVRAGERYENRGSEYAIEGTEAHLLCEYKLKQALGIQMDDPKPTLEFYSEQMAMNAENYVAYVVELYEKAKEECVDPVVLIEQQISYEQWVKDGFGTSDAIVVSDGVLHVIDYKNGSGILVESEDNSQMRCYALGCLAMFEGIYNITDVAMHIFQPNRDNISVSMLVKEDLLDWAENVLKPAAALAYEGLGDYACGDWCQFCPIKHTCRKRSEFAMEAAKYDFADTAELTDTEIEDVLARVDELTSWASDVKDYALRQALSGKEWVNWKVVAGRSVRKYADEGKVAQAVIDAGYEPYEKKLLGITAMTQTLGKQRFNELLGALIIKPEGKPVLVPLTDKRPPMNTAKEDFKEE